ncbi:MAG TPA: hypothetical protein VEE82_00425, partial [Thermodesulfovibrionales bacterium]|nr:hypothetical protein [Thermodesulfovibrionales bacterium]
MAKVIKSIIPALIIFCVFLYGLIPINDFDFWWHLKTGEYILENGQLPDIDPFSYTAVSTDMDSPGRPQFILKSYWLGQVVFALVVKYLGLKGFIAMRAIFFALISLTVLKVQGLQSAVSGPKSGVPELRTRGALYSQAGCALLFSLAMLTTECLTDRPQMFSFLFAIFLVFLFERYRVCASRAALYAIPLLMLLWAQIHAGYIVGIAYLLVYLMAIPFEECLKEKRKILIPL